MGIISRARKLFGLTYEPTMQSDKVAATKTITNDLVGYLLGLSNFGSLSEDQIYEQFYVWEPEIGGSIDRMSTMVGEAYQYCFVEEDNESEDDELIKKMVKDANKIAKTAEVKHYHEVFAEMLQMYGNLFLEPAKDGQSVTILPNRYVTLIDTTDRLNAYYTEKNNNIITEANFLVLFEGQQWNKVIPKDKFIHVKYKDTPIFVKDTISRMTYNLYAISPLQRTIIPIWWKRQTMIIDIMWRLRNVPREHHKVDATMFSLDNYVGDMKTRRTAATADAKTFLDTYVENINNQLPDQGYATLSTVEIDTIGGNTGSYMQTNELIAQINDQVWAATNMPKSMILGESTGTYASELVIANYLEHKIDHLTDKIKPVILSIIRARLKSINKSYPVDKLDIYYDTEISTTELEVFRQLAIMAELGVFTEDEIRERAKYAPLTDKQRKQVVDRKMDAQSKEVPGMMSGKQTPQSNVQHPTDSGENKYRKIER